METRDWSNSTSNEVLLDILAAKNRERDQYRAEGAGLRHNAILDETAEAWEEKKIPDPTKKSYPTSGGRFEKRGRRR